MKSNPKLDLTAVPVVIPNLSILRSFLPMMGSTRDVPEVYRKAYLQSGNRLVPQSLTTITEPAQIAGFLEQWFFRGLLSLKFKLKPGAASCNDHEFSVFVAKILQDMEPSHEHKMMFLTQVIHVCCESVTYQIKA